jgi:hypothetical protein
MAVLARKLVAILRIPLHRQVAALVAVPYLLLYLTALGDISPGGSGSELLTAEWRRMFDRTGPLTFEPIAQLTLPGVTMLLSPVNLLIGLLVSLLAAVNLTVSYVAFRQPSVCRFNRFTGILASLPALLAGGACCAPTIVLILGLQVSSLLMSVFQVLIPLSVLLLLVTLVLALGRTDTDRLAARCGPDTRS